MRYTKILLKKSTTSFDETSLEEIICKMQQNGKIDGKFKIINHIYDEKFFWGRPPRNDKSYIPKETVDSALVNSKNENSNNDN